MKQLMLARVTGTVAFALCLSGFGPCVDGSKPDENPIDQMCQDAVRAVIDHHLEISGIDYNDDGAADVAKKRESITFRDLLDCAPSIACEYAKRVVPTGTIGAMDKIMLAWKTYSCLDSHGAITRMLREDYLNGTDVLGAQH